MRHEVTYGGTELNTTRTRAKIISLDEARRRAKPLPPLGPMSPSILKGVVEIGGRWEDSFADVGLRPGVVREGKRRKGAGLGLGISGLFRRRPKGDEEVF